MQLNIHQQQFAPPNITEKDISEKGAWLHQLNNQFQKARAEDVLDYILGNDDFGAMGYACSFGAEAAVLLHLIAQRKPDLPILFLNSGKLFAETLAYQKQLSAALGLTNVIEIHPNENDINTHDPYGDLHLKNGAGCCHIRKVLPLQNALAGYDSWLNGRKRYHGAARTEIDHFELDEDGRIKINPLALWGKQQIITYRETHNLPSHPLVKMGYPSLGCAPCTRRTGADDAVRAGRFQDQGRSECGIHDNPARQAWLLEQKSQAEQTQNKGEKAA